MDYLPIFLDVRGRECLLIGGGTVALRKAELLQQAGARLRVVAPALCSGLEALAHAGELTLVRREYESSDLAGALLVVAATDRDDVNARVAADAKARALLVNVVDAPEFCSFIMPAVVDRSPIVVAISTGGASPLLARLTRARVEAVLPDGLGRLAQFAAQHRVAVQRAIAESERRRAFWQQLFEGEIAELVLAHRMDEAEIMFGRALDGAPALLAIRVALIGCGSGDADRLSFAAVRWLGATDVVVHAGPLSPSVIRVIRRDAERVGVAAGAGELGARVAEHAGHGRQVAWLCGGDPGAGPSAEAESLRGAGLRFVLMRPAPD